MPCFNHFKKSTGISKNKAGINHFGIDIEIRKSLGEV